MRWWKLAGAALLLASCTETNPRVCSATERCADPTTQFCDFAGVLGDTRNSCLAISCVAGAPLACTGDQLYVCDGAGSYEIATCELGCAAIGVGCARLVPANGLLAQLDASANAPDIELIDGDLVDVATGQVTNAGAIRIQLIGETIDRDSSKIRVYPARTLHVTGVVELITTSSTRPTAPAFMVQGAAIIDGDLVLAARGLRAPPGARWSTDAGQGKVVGESAIGGGGGGHATVGAAGGEITGEPAVPSERGGSAIENPRLEPLLGGMPGALDPALGLVSHGGGAVQISSRTRIQLTPRGFINANAVIANVVVEGAGGGAGGGILLEAPFVELAGGAALSANGAGGTAGNGALPTPPGRGTLSVGGQCQISLGCSAGGAGGALQPAQVPLPIANQFGGVITGGGGGSVGYIVIHTADGTVAAEAGAVISPPARVGVVAAQ